VFAPTDEAFAAALDALGLTAEELLADTELLTSVLTYHVIPGEVLAETVLTLDGASVETVNGAFVTIGVDGEMVTVNDANVVAVDVAASNGVIHVIDAVLLPPA
jgi:transforming growth factor-beta-induced protein